MPLAFSTLGCPHAPVSDVVDLAVRHGVDGVELRASDDGPVHVGLPQRGRDAVRRALEDRGLTTLALDSYVRVRAPGDDRRLAADLDAHLDLAAQLGCTYLRIFPGGDPADLDGDARAAHRIAEAAAPARVRGIRLALETHDSRPRGHDVARILHEAGRLAASDESSLAAVWDVLHPWRAGEAPSATASALGRRLAYVQVKDSRPGPSGPLTTVGDGAVPLDDVVRAVDALGRGRHDVWWSLEWERAWHPELPDLEVALTGFRTWWDRLG